MNESRLENGENVYISVVSGIDYEYRDGCGISPLQKAIKWIGIHEMILQSLGIPAHLIQPKEYDVDTPIIVENNE